jgi:hypothetical protein
MIHAMISVHDLRANTFAALELRADDLTAVYGKRIDTLLRGRAVVMGKMLHKIVRVIE